MFGCLPPANEELDNYYDIETNNSDKYLIDSNKCGYNCGRVIFILSIILFLLLVCGVFLFIL